MWDFNQIKYKVKKLEVSMFIKCLLIFFLKALALEGRILRTYLKYQIMTQNNSHA